MARKQIDLYVLQNIAEKTLQAVGIFNRKVTIRWDGDNEAYTDGQSFIVLSKVFDGVDLTRRTKRNLALLTGIIQHEVVHWLQDLPAIHAAQHAAHLPNFVRNIIDDIQGERMIIDLLGKGNCKPLYTARRLIFKTNKQDYINGILNAENFPDDAMSVALYGRFRKAMYPYVHTKGSAKTLRGLQWSSYLRDRTPALPADLPAFMTQVANDFPELTQLPEGQPTDGQMFPVVASQSGMDAEEMNNAVSTMRGRYATYRIRHTACSPIKGAPELAAKIRIRLEREPTSLTINAIGDVNRRLLATDADVPFDYTVESDNAIGRNVLICLDRSGSMIGEDNGDAVGELAQPTVLPRGQDVVFKVDDNSSLVDDNMSKSLKVAQAIAMAVKQENGSVVGVLFGEYALMASGEDSSAILFPRCGHDLITGGTSFLWLKWLWQKYPDYQVIVITDGGGQIPDVITKRERERTTLIKLTQPGYPTATEIDAVAGKVIELTEVKNLASYMLDIIN